MCKVIHNLLVELDEIWNCTNDVRLKGENPAYDRTIDKLFPLMQMLSDDELQCFISNLSKDQQDQLLQIFEDMADDRPFLKLTIQNILECQ